MGSGFGVSCPGALRCRRVHENCHLARRRMLLSGVVRRPASRERVGGGAIGWRTCRAASRRLSWLPERYTIFGGSSTMHTTLKRMLVAALVAGAIALVFLFVRHQDSIAPESASPERQPTSPPNPIVASPGTPSLTPQPSPPASPSSDEGDRKFRLYSTVHSKTGEPAGGVNVWYETPRGGWISSTTGSDGSFILGNPYQQLPLELFAARNMYLPRTSVRWTEGGLDRPIVVETGRDLRLRVDSEKRMNEMPSLIPTAFASSIPGPQIAVRRAGPSEFIAEGVLPEVAYDVWMQPSSDGEYVFKRGVRFDDDGMKLHPLKANAFARGKVVTAPGTHSVYCSVVIRPGLAVLTVMASKDNAFVIGPMPVGEWEAEAHATDDLERHWFWYGRLSTDSPGTIVLRR